MAISCSTRILRSSLRKDLAPRDQIQVVLVESAARQARLPYQRKKLVLLLSAMRHYAAELEAAGYAVDYVAAESAVAGLRQHVDRWRPERLLTMAAAEYRGLRLQHERLDGLLGLPVTVLPNTQFLVGRHNPFPEPPRKVILENFYRALRRHFHLLLDEHVGSPSAAPGTSTRRIGGRSPKPASPPRRP